jgi:hypothetical protein
MGKKENKKPPDLTYFPQFEKEQNFGICHISQLSIQTITIKVKIIMQRMWRSDHEFSPEVNKQREVSQYLILEKVAQGVLPTLVTRRKWNESIESLNIGDLVLVKDINNARGN